MLLVLSRTYDTDIALYFTAYGYGRSRAMDKKTGRQVLVVGQYSLPLADAHKFYATKSDSERRL